MTARQVDQPPSAEDNAAGALMPLSGETPASESGQPGGGQGRIDVTGIIPEGIHIDPNLTEGHPGYEESGGSQIRLGPMSTATGRLPRQEADPRYRGAGTAPEQSGEGNRPVSQPSGGGPSVGGQVEGP